MLTSPYAHAGLASGEARSSKLGDENVDILLVFITFREHVKKTQKPLRGLRLVALDGSESTSDHLSPPKGEMFERFEIMFTDVFATRHDSRRPEKKSDKDVLESGERFRCTHVTFG